MHEDKAEATEKAKKLVEAAVAKALLLEALEEKEVDVIPSCLIIGAGIAGIQAALDIADAGFKVYLVEKTPSVGGRMAQLDKTFPTLDCSACILTPKMVDVANHPNIELMTYSQLEEISGFVGNFKAKIRKKARYVDFDKCTGCGVCAENCRLAGRIPNEFDENIGMRGAIYLPFPQAVPAKYTIDPQRCLQLSKGKCGKEGPACAAACGPGAINFEQEDEFVEIEIGTVIVATGYDVFDMHQETRVRLGRERQRLDRPRVRAPGVGLRSHRGKPILGRDKKGEGGYEPKKVAFIHCVGSRDKSVGNEYCSQGMLHVPGKAGPPHPGQAARRRDQRLLHGRAGVRQGLRGVLRQGEARGRALRARQPLGDLPAERRKATTPWSSRSRTPLPALPWSHEADLVVLGVGLEPRRDIREIIDLFKLSQSTDGFFLEAHPKLRPVDTASDGVYPGGLLPGTEGHPRHRGPGQGRRVQRAHTDGLLGRSRWRPWSPWCRRMNAAAAGSAWRFARSAPSSWSRKTAWATSCRWPWSTRPSARAAEAARRRACPAPYSPSPSRMNRYCHRSLC